MRLSTVQHAASLRDFNLDLMQRGGTACDQLQLTLVHVRWLHDKHHIAMQRHCLMLTAAQQDSVEVQSMLCQHLKTHNNLMGIDGCRAPSPPALCDLQAGPQDQEVLQVRSPWLPMSSHRYSHHQACLRSLKRTVTHGAGALCCLEAGSWGLLAWLANTSFCPRLSLAEGHVAFVSLCNPGDDLD